MRVKKEAREIWEEYQGGRDYNTSIGLYENYKLNEKFFIGDQWTGAKADDMLKVTMNFLKRVVTFFVSQLSSDDIGVCLAPYAPDAGY